MTVYRLILLRHAKSAWEQAAITDHDRPLAPRGVEDARRMGRELVTRGWLPQVVVASDARRTRDTWELMAPAFGPKVAFYTESALYLGGGRRMVRTARGIPDEVHCAMVVGHNPDCEEALAYLSGHSERITTANAILLETDATGWEATIAKPGQWELVDVLRPKTLGAKGAGGYPRPHGR